MSEGEVKIGEDRGSLAEKFQRRCANCGTCPLLEAEAAARGQSVLELQEDIRAELGSADADDGAEARL